MKKSKKPNFITSLWNGNESLGTSFWAVYIIGGTIVSLPAWVLPETSYAIFFFVPSKEMIFDNFILCKSILGKTSNLIDLLSLDFFLVM